ncbi:MAG: glycoside hydrolase family 55 protein, partial [Isosphaeraceae bacterium]|nr:glycoside hydrolase family 55 protein [Isosphaeraceae bacterium]
MIPKRSASWIVLAATLGILAQIGGNAVNAAENIVFPRDAGIVNVKDYGAKGDGVHDDTAAIQRALDEQPNQGAIVYLPNGTYRISDTLKWPHGPRGGMEQKNTTLQGQSRDRTIIRLQDACPGYDDPKRPKALIGASRRPAQQFRNAVRNLTIDSGRRNPGAVGLQFIANNQGGIRDVTIRSGDGRALVGLDLAYTDAIGPLLVRDLKVVGFDIGIKTAHAVNSMTFEHITLEHQNRFGFVNQGPCVSIRDLTSRNAVPALINAQGPGLVTLVDATLYGHRGANAKPAIFNEATLFARNIKAVGYVEAIHNAANEQKAQGLQVAEFVSHPILSLFPAPLKSLGLPVPETPEVPWDDPQGWASPTHFGARPDDEEDDTQALQKAIDSGKTTLYLPRGGYVINGTVLV